MEEDKHSTPAEEASVKIYVPQHKAVPVRQQAGFLDHAPVRIYERPVRKEMPLPPAFQ
jgi:hypothetical protein